MSSTSELLFEYLKKIFYEPSEAELDLEQLDEDYVNFGKGLKYFASCVAEYKEYAEALSRGDLSIPLPPPENELTAPLKNLHASLKHLTWQSKQVALGDYKQRVDFMGEFADAFNTMIVQLADRQKKLEDEIETSNKHVLALEQGNMLLSNVTRHIPQQIFVVNEDTFEPLLMNATAERELENDRLYMEKVLGLLPKMDDRENCYNIEVPLVTDDTERYLYVSSYYIQWDRVSAIALVINDISDEKRQMLELEQRAYRDSLTHLFNRFFGMLTLNEWHDLKKVFALIFVDMDNLKYVNDEFGHNDGDRYITNVAKHLSSISPDAAVCRIGGDEFMILVPEYDKEKARDSMEEVQILLQTDEYLIDKDYTYSLSYGIVYVGADNELPPSSLLSLADERMYEHKRARKKERQSQQTP